MSALKRLTTTAKRNPAAAFGPNSLLSRNSLINPVLPLSGEEVTHFTTYR